MHPDTTDASPEAEKVQSDLIRHISPTERERKALQRTTRLIGECKPAIAGNNPGLAPQQIGFAFIELDYGQELAAAVRRSQSDRAHR